MTKDVRAATAALGAALIVFFVAQHFAQRSSTAPKAMITIVAAPDQPRPDAGYDAARAIPTHSPTTAPRPETPETETIANVAENQRQLRHLVTTQVRDQIWAPAAEHSLIAAIGRLPGSGARDRPAVYCAAYICEVRLALRPEDSADLHRAIVAPAPTDGPTGAMLDPPLADLVFIGNDPRTGRTLTAYFPRRPETSIDPAR